MAKKELLTGEQRENILELNQLSEFEFASYYSLSDDDIDVINHHRGVIRTTIRNYTVA